MPQALTNAALISFLKENYASAGFIEGLKIKYRSLICPFINLLQHIKPGDKVGDVGCGSGQFLLLATEFAQPQSVYGIEISERLVGNARALFKKRANSDFGFSVYDGIHFPENLREMDILFLIDVLHHVGNKNRELFIKNLAGAMKPGARLVLKDIDKASPFVYFNKLHDMIFAGEIGNEISLAEAVSLLQKNGLRIVEQRKQRMYVYPHYSIVAEKEANE